MPNPRPISITQASSADTDRTPRPLLLVGKLPAGAVPAATTSAIGAVKKAASVTVDETPADATAVATDLKAVVDALKAAGIMA